MVDGQHASLKPHPVQVESHQGTGHEQRAWVEVRQVPDLKRDLVQANAPPLTSQEHTMPAPAPMLSPPVPPTTPSSPTPAVERPRREAKPNPKHSPEMSDLSKVDHMEKIDELEVGGYQGAGEKSAQVEAGHVPDLERDQVHGGPEEVVGIQFRQVPDQVGPTGVHDASTHAKLAIAPTTAQFSIAHTHAEFAIATTSGEEA